MGAPPLLLRLVLLESSRSPDLTCATTPEPAATPVSNSHVRRADAPNAPNVPDLRAMSVSARLANIPPARTVTPHDPPPHWPRRWQDYGGGVEVERRWWTDARVASDQFGHELVLRHGLETMASAQKRSPALCLTQCRARGNPVPGGTERLGC